VVSRFLPSLLLRWSFVPDVLNDRPTDLGGEAAIVRARERGQFGANLGLDVRGQLNTTGRSSTFRIHAELFSRGSRP
jgi:hypothetical protein